MFDRLLDLIITLWEDIWCLKIVRENNKGVLLRYGKVRRVYEPGLVFKLPFVDDLIIQFTGDDTIVLPSQKLITKDGKQVTVKAVVVYNVVDVIPFTMNVNQAYQSLSDVSSGVISDIILKLDYSELKDNLEELNNKASKAVRKEVKKWGAHIDTVSFTDITTSRSFNIFKDGEAHL